MRKFTVQVSEVTANCVVEANSANCIQFINEGTVAASVLGIALPASGGMWGVQGEAGEVDVTTYPVTFAAAGGRLVVVKKIYQ